MMSWGSGRSADLVWISCIDTSSSPYPSPGASMKKDFHRGVGGAGSVSVRRSAWMIWMIGDKRGVDRGLNKCFTFNVHVTRVWCIGCTRGLHGLPCE